MRGPQETAHQHNESAHGHAVGDGEPAYGAQGAGLADGDGFEDGHAMSVGRYLHQVYILYYENKFLTIKIFLAL
jgi:hypothetical protein